MAKNTIEFSVIGMDCASCAQNIHKQLQKVKGVISSEVSYAHEKAVIVYDSQECSKNSIKKVIEELNYQVYEKNEGSKTLAQLEKKNQLVRMYYQCIVSGILSGVLLVGAMVPFSPEWLRNPWLAWLLATPVQFWAGWRYYKSAWAAFKHGMANMDTLIALGTSVAYGYSVFVVLFSQYLQRAGIETHLYFEASATIITFILLGKYLEIRAQGKTSQAIAHLIGLQPKTATLKKEVVGSDQSKKYEWITISVEQIREDDILQIKPGERIAVDGVLISGESTVDESMVTGESLPIIKALDALVIGGSTNLTGSFEMRATKVGKETLLAGIISLVQKAQASKAPVQALVDKISGVFVPIVIVVALITFGLWFVFGPEPRFLHALASLVAVLIVACPCALGLATPTSLIVGMGRGAQEGILIKNAEMLERAGKIDVVVFDKTGTLTEGKQKVHEFQFIDKINQETFKDSSAAIILSVEKLSNHPVSLAVVNYLEQTFKQLKEYEVNNFKAVLGLGVQALVDGKQILIGSERLMKENTVLMSEHVDTCALEWSKSAKTVSFIAFDKKLVAFFCVADTIRQEARDAIAALHARNIETLMITGDNPVSAQAVADQVGIKKVLSQVLPEDKQKEITRLCGQGRVVAMVGDGINDAPALAVADIGIAMGGGTDIALETAGAALLRNDLMLVSRLILLSRATMRNIKQNLVWAFGYNILLIPVAVGVLYPVFGIKLNPMLAGASMAFSSVSVVVNALRLKKIKL